MNWISGRGNGRADSAAFDARAYYEQLITTSSLPTLLKTENDLLTGKHIWSHLVRRTRNANSIYYTRNKTVG